MIWIVLYITAPQHLYIQLQLGLDACLKGQIHTQTNEHPKLSHGMKGRCSPQDKRVQSQLTNY